jgi:hypothetical protein
MSGIQGDVILPSRGDEYLQTVSEDILRGVTNFNST